MTETRLTARQELLLTFLNAPDRRKLSPLQITKGLFLFSMEAPPNWFSQKNRYKFRAHHYGPFSFELYPDLSVLHRLGYVEAQPNPGTSWHYYVITTKGETAAEQAAKGLGDPALRYISRLREFVTSVTLRQLLAAVYSRHPKFATNSIFQF